jgi:hypothetical protein
VLFLCSCTSSNKNNDGINISNLDQIYPAEISRFDQVDSVYFSYLGISSLPLHDGSFVLAVQEPSYLVHISSDGKRLVEITKKGRGPGELTDIGVPTLDQNNNIYVFDRNKKASVVFDSMLTFIQEFQIPSNKNLYVDIPYHLDQENYLVEMNSIQWMLDSDESKFLVFSLFDRSKDSYSETFKFIDRQYAQSENPAPPSPTEYHAEYLGGDRAISFSAKQLYTLSNDKKSLFLYNTSSKEIAELDFNFDTLRTIGVNFPTEMVTSQEVDSVRKGIQESETIINNLISRMPSKKTPIERMIIDHKNRFWLHSNLRGNYEVWFVMDQEGNVKKMVHLPKNSFLTHVSKDHLGVRLDDSTFGLFKTIE